MSLRGSLTTPFSPWDCRLSLGILPKGRLCPCEEDVQCTNADLLPTRLEVLQVGMDDGWAS